MSLFEDDGPDVADALRNTARGISGSGNAVIAGLKTLTTGLVGGAASGLLFSPLLLGFGALAIGVGGAVSALKLFTDEATKYGRALSSLRANQGLSFGQGFALTSRNSLFGISAGESAQMFAAPGMNPIMAGIRGRALGFDSPYSPAAMLRNAQSYQAMASKGVFGRQMANSRLDALYGGKAPDSVRQAMNLSPGQIRGQLAYGQKIQGAMGIRPAMLQRYAEQIPLAKQRVSYAFDMAKVRMAVEIAPLLERSLTSFATLLANNAPKIAQGISTLGKFLVQDFPPMLMRGAAWVARGLGNMLMGFSGFTGGLAKNARPMLGTFDMILNGLRKFAGVAAGIAGMIVQGVGALWAGIQKTGLPKFLSGLAARATGIPNDTPEGRTANGIIAGAALKIGAPIIAGAAVPLLLRGLFGGGGAAGGSPGLIARGLTYGAGALSGAWGAASSGAGVASIGIGPIAVATGIGAGIGIAGGAGLNYIGRKTGLLDPTVGFGERMKNGWGRARDAATGNWGHYDKVESARINAQNAAAADQKRAEQARRALQARDPLSALAYVPGRSTGDAFKESSGAALRSIGISNMANNPKIVGTLDMMFGDASKSSAAGAQKLFGLGDTLDKSATNYTKNIAEQLEALNKTANKIDANTNKGADSQAELIREFPNMMRQLVALTSSFIAQDAAMSLLGS